MSAATAYRTAPPASVARFTLRRFPASRAFAVAIFWALLVAFLGVAFVRTAPAVDLRCVRGAAVRCSVVRSYPLFGQRVVAIDDVRSVEREMKEGEARLVLVTPAARVPLSERFATDEVRRLQQMRLERFIAGDERSLDLPYDLLDRFAATTLLAPLLLLPVLLLLLDRSRIVLRGEALSITHLVAGVWPTTRVVSRSRIVATRIDERVVAPGELRYRVVIALDSGEAVSVLRRETSDLERSEACLAWLRDRVGAA